MLIQITHPNGLQKFIIMLTTAHYWALFQGQLTPVDIRKL
jgi:hypothetical protein